MGTNMLAEGSLKHWPATWKEGIVGIHKVAQFMGRLEVWSINALMQHDQPAVYGTRFGLCSINLKKSMTSKIQINRVTVASVIQYL